MYLYFVLGLEWALCCDAESESDPGLGPLLQFMTFTYKINLRIQRSKWNGTDEAKKYTSKMK